MAFKHSLWRCSKIHRSQKKRLLVTLTAFRANSVLLFPTGTFYETQPPCDLQREQKCWVAFCLYFNGWKEESPLLITLPGSFQEPVNNCNTLGRKFLLQIFGLGGIILGKDQPEQFSFFAKTSIRGRGALLSVLRNLPTSSLRNCITSPIT